MVLSKEQKTLIGNLLNDGMGQRDIGKELNIDKSAVNRYAKKLNGKQTIQKPIDANNDMDLINNMIFNTKSTGKNPKESDDPQNDMDKETKINQILSLQDAFETNTTYERKALSGKTLNKLKATHNGLLQNINKSVSEEIPMHMLYSTLCVTEYLSSKLGVNMSSPNSLAVNVKENPNTRKLLKQINILSSFTDKIVNPYAMLSLSIAQSAIGTIKENSRTSKAPTPPDSVYGVSSPSQMPTQTTHQPMAETVSESVSEVQIPSYMVVENQMAKNRVIV